ncbi:MAG: polyprenyl synthetase family protein [Thermomicrobiales bacterium]
MFCASPTHLTGWPWKSWPGRVTDLESEGGREASHHDYLRMISMKTAAIVEFACWSGAIAAGADEGIADQFAQFGRALGLGFQIQDDVLGIPGVLSQQPVNQPQMTSGDASSRCPSFCEKRLHHPIVSA